jgi:kinesin family protein 1
MYLIPVISTTVYRVFAFQLENCGRPAIITKDLSMIIYGRDARTGPRSLKHLFSGNYRNAEANRLSGVYELVLKRASEAGSPGLFPVRPTNNA